MNKSFFLMLTVCAFAACGSDEVEPTPTPDPKPELVKMSFLVNAGEETRTVLMHGEGKENQVWFHNGDEICIFDNTDNHKFTTTLKEDSPSCTFTGEAHHTAAGFFYALYPYQSTASFTGSFYADIPQTQTPVLDSFDPKANVSVACIPMPDSQSSDFVITKLYNACALVKFTSTIELRSVKLESESEDGWLSGAMNIKIDPDRQAPTDLSNLTFSYPSSDSSEKFTFHDVELSNSNESVFVPGTYYIAVWPGKYTNLKIILTNSEGKTKTGTLNKVTFNRAKIFNLGTFN